MPRLGLAGQGMYYTVLSLVFDDYDRYVLVIICKIQQLKQWSVIGVTTVNP